MIEVFWLTEESMAVSPTFASFKKMLFDRESDGGILKKNRY
jgi:hypothetical protein